VGNQRQVLTKVCGDEGIRRPDIRGESMLGSSGGITGTMFVPPRQSKESLGLSSCRGGERRTTEGFGSGPRFALGGRAEEPLGSVSPVRAITAR
jgi:hypothetical protein